MPKRADLIPIERIEGRILLLRGQKVMLSTHLAELYEVPPKVMIQSVKRNLDRFPDDFLFQLTCEEFSNLKSQFVTSSWGAIPPPEEEGPKKGIGFHVRERRAAYGCRHRWKTKL